MYIGIDIGGTKTALVGSSSLDDINFERQFEIPTNQNFEEGIEQLKSSIREITDNPIAIGIGIPGSVEGREFTGSFNLKEWVGKPIVRTIEDEFKCPVVMNNDAIAGALGEAHFGLDERSKFFYLTWGTGFGCAQVEWIDEIARASRPDDRTPVYAVEEKIGGLKIESRFGKKAADLTDDEWSNVISDLTNSLEELSKIYNYDLVVLGGGITSKQKARIEDKLSSLNSPKVHISTLSGDAALYGALALIKEYQQ